MDISPDTQNINRVFADTAYFIDFYQRDYRWTDEPVFRLLDDIFFEFEEQYNCYSNLDPSKETVTAYYPWYYLNTYVTNAVDGRTYIVDGQQRLTTLSLILIKLRHLAESYKSKSQMWLENKIASHHGFERTFWMKHVGHESTQQALLDDKDAKDIDTSSGTTAANMVANYGIISAFIDKKLKKKHIFETFVFYFLYRLVFINLAVEQTDVSMVFEVINDRGVKLQPYEILKGKLLGQIDKTELDKGEYNELWEKQANTINAFKEDEMNVFFRSYLKAKYADTRNEGTKFESDYHRAMFATEMDDKLGLLHNPANVKTFLKGAYTYYSNLFIKLRKAYSSDQEPFRGVYYNSLLALDAPFHLAIAACCMNDPNEDTKIRVVSEEIDRYVSLLHLQNAYVSTEFNESLFRIAAVIREKNPEIYRAAFDVELTATIAARRNMPEAKPLSYAVFKQTGISLNILFKRYFFARIDEFLAKQMNLNMKHPIADLVTKTSAKTGFHVEHILSWNDENKALFDNDEELFEQERNRLGGILLLKGKDNISSSNEPYSEKLKSYANTLYWNETLREDSYKSKLDMNALKTDFDLNLVPLEKFGRMNLKHATYYCFS